MLAGCPDVTVLRSRRNDSNGWARSNSLGDDARGTTACVEQRGRLEFSIVASYLRRSKPSGFSRERRTPGQRAKRIVVTPAGQKLLRQAICVVEDEDAAFFSRGGALDKRLLKALRALASDVS